MRISFRRSLSALFISSIIVLGLMAGYFWYWLQTAQPVPEDQRVFTVQPGESVSRVAFRLSEAEVIRWPDVWRLYARFMDSTPIISGEYQLDLRESPQSILNLLQSGEVITYAVTLVEGQTFSDFVARLALHDKIEARLVGLSQEEQLAKLGVDVVSPEGWFFPDTYQFTAGETDVQILRRAYHRMVNVLEQEWQARMNDLPYETSYEVLIMASIIERETGVGYERPEIAGVFVRRLQKGMRLQTDPTVIYGMGERYQGRITRRDLRESTPYNTYRIPALPPTPIAMPGAAAIRAAVNPAPGDALYFVAKGDGSHHFSATLAEHNAAVNKYQRNRVEGYRSSPPPSQLQAPESQ